MTTRRLLVMAYYYPPYGGGYSIRVGRFVKYLSRLGWECTVVSVDPAAYTPDVARTGGDETGAAAVHRTPSLERLLPAGGGAPAAGDAPAAGGGGGGGLARRLKHFVLLPDRMVLWTPYALRAARRLHREAPFHAALATAPPMSTIPAAAALRRLLGIPTVLDLRDDWTGTATFATLPPARRRVEAVLERATLRRFDHLLVPTRPSADRLLGEFRLPPERVTLLPNGFDPEDLPPPGQVSPPPLRPGRTALVHLGTLSGRRSPATLLEALRRLAETDPDAARRLWFLQVGAVDPAFGPALRSLAEEDLAQARPAVPHGEALEMMRAAEVLVLIPSQSTATAIPGKAYEYLACGRPVLALVEPGATRDLLRELGAGWVVDVADVEAITGALRAIAAGAWTPALADPAALARYDRQVQAGRLSEILHRLVGERSSPAGV